MLTYKQINLYNSNRKRQGCWEEYWSDGDLRTKGYYKNGKINGYWENHFCHPSELWFKGNSINGQRSGLVKWYVKKQLIKEIFYVNI